METDLKEVCVAAIGVDRFSGDQQVFLRSQGQDAGLAIDLTAGQATALLLRLEHDTAPEQSPYATIAALLHDNGLTPLRVLISPAEKAASLLYHDGVEDRGLPMSCGEGTVLATYLDLPLLVSQDALYDIEPELVSRRRRMDVLYLSKV
jgi:hypothetical protein